jgi:uncharacterized protein (DUF58 family)
MKRLLLRLLPKPTPASPEPGPLASGAAAQALLERLEWTVLRRLDGQAQGAARTLRLGHGLDLADLREYQVHDDVRRIDWNLSARMGSPHVRIDLEERDLTVWFLVDATPSQGFGSRLRSKQALAQEAVAALGRVFTRAGHRVGAVVHHGGTTRDTVLAPRGGREQVLRLLEAVQQRDAGPTPKAQGLTRLADLLRRAEPWLKQRAVVFLVSDFISEPGWEPLLGRLGQRHEMLAVRLLDPIDHALPHLGLVRLHDSETGEQLLVDLEDRGLHERYARLAADRDTKLQDGLARAGVDVLELSTEEDLGLALLRFARQRQAQRQGAARAAFLQTLREPTAPDVPRAPLEAATP